MPIEVVTEDGVFIASNSTLEITSAVNVNVKRLIIKSGNVFQPHSKLTISFYDISNNIDDGNEKEINLSIGSNNLFEEYSSVVMHYDWLDMEGVENNIGKAHFVILYVSDMFNIQYCVIKRIEK